MRIIHTEQQGSVSLGGVSGGMRRAYKRGSRIEASFRDGQTKHLRPSTFRPTETHRLSQNRRQIENLINMKLASALCTWALAMAGAAVGDGEASWFADTKLTVLTRNSCSIREAR